MEHRSSRVTVKVDEAVHAVLARLRDHMAVGSGTTLVDAGKGLFLETKLQAVFNDRPADPAERALHQVFMVHAIEAEKMGPGGFDACLALVESSIMGREPDPMSTLVGRRPTSVDIDKMVADSCLNAPGHVMRAITDALRLAGLGGRVVVEKTAPGTKPSVELVRGYTFVLAALFPFSGVLVAPRVALVDGFIESVGEIDGLLQESHASMDAMLLFARGMADDVVSTLRVNHERGALRIVPIHVPMEPASLNTLADIAVVSGAGVITAAKGDLISSLRLAACPRLEQAGVHAGRVMLVSSTQRAEVASHVAALRQKRLEATHEELGGLIDARVRSLSPGHVVLRLPDDRDFVPSAQALDRSLRCVSASVSRGVIAGHGLMLPDPAPMGSVAGALIHARRCVHELSRIGAIVTS